MCRSVFIYLFIYYFIIFIYLFFANNPKDSSLLLISNWKKEMTILDKFGLFSSCFYTTLTVGHWSLHPLIVSKLTRTLGLKQKFCFAIEFKICNFAILYVCSVCFKYYFLCRLYPFLFALLYFLSSLLKLSRVSISEWFFLIHCVLTLNKSLLTRQGNVRLKFRIMLCLFLSNQGVHLCVYSCM